MDLKHLTGAFIVSILTASSAYADDCMSKASSQSGMDACAQKAYAASDAELNAVYREIQQRLGDNAAAKKKLVFSQRAWITYRDAECKFAASGSEGGSVYPMTMDMCLDRLTQKRSQELKAYLKCPEGDTSCPVPGG